jgi:hypothetical protein
MTHSVDTPIWLRGVLDLDALNGLDPYFDGIPRPGNRLPLDGALRAALAPVDRQIQKIAPHMRPVRALAFNKSAQTNWALPWHQDRVIATQGKVEIPGFRNWSHKEAVWHCEPPVEILTQMLFVRVHMDDTAANSGAMEIAKGSHKAGVVTSDRAAQAAADYPSEECVASRGDILILPMLTLHRSLAAPNPCTRRVFRLDYAAAALPAPLLWAN